MASVNATLTVAPNVASSVTITTVGTLIGSVPAGTVVAEIQVSPASWTGTLALSGANASSFVLNPGGIVAGTQYAGFLAVGAVTITAGSYAVTVTATP